MKTYLGDQILDLFLYGLPLLWYLIRLSPAVQSGCMTNVQEIAKRIDML